MRKNQSAKRKVGLHDRVNLAEILISDEKKGNSHVSEHLLRQHSEPQQNQQSINIRMLASAVLLLLVSSHLLLMIDKAFEPPLPKISYYQVDRKKTKIKVSIRPLKEAHVIDYLEPGEIVESYRDENLEFQNYLQIISPIAGFVRKKSLESGKEFLKKIEDTGTYRSPYVGWWPSNVRLNVRYRYAPTVVVIAQQLWNAMQVAQLYLLICICCTYFHDSKHRLNIAIAALAISVVLLPFSLYVTSPGGSMFSVITLLISVIGVKMEHKDLELSMENFRTEAFKKRLSDDVTNAEQSPLTPPAVWFVFREEALAFICNLCSSLYNYNASRNTFPYWNSGFRRVDSFFGWAGGGPNSKLECTIKGLYTLGFNIHIPLFVPRATGSSTGSFLFLLLWSIIPFFYVSYFGCMIAMSSHSPGTRIQRCLAFFGIFHFLFMTDAVTYKYGRGFWSPHSELFHWFERISWRIAILLPIYQNFTSGHWKRGYYGNPMVGKVVHYFMAGWGIMFLIRQVILSDVFLFLQFLSGWEEKNALTMLGLGHFNLKILSYHGGLVISWVVYGFILVEKFSHYCISLRPKGEKAGNYNSRMHPKTAMLIKASFVFIFLIVFFCCWCRSGISIDLGLEEESGGENEINKITSST